MSNREASRPSISEVTVTKPLTLLQVLFKSSVTGDAGVKVKSVVQTGAEKVKSTLSTLWKK